MTRLPGEGQVNDATFDGGTVSGLLMLQDGVVSRPQLRARGVSDSALRRFLRRRELAVAAPGVYVHHTGPLSWTQRAWVGVLAAAHGADDPVRVAALGGDAALRSSLGSWRRQRDRDPIEIVVPKERTPVLPAGYRLRRIAGFSDRVVPASPPCLTIADAALDVAARAPRDVDAIGILADVCQSRGTSAQQLLERLAARRWISRRSFLSGVLSDVADGTCSVLEHAYLVQVERAHGLPVGRRQAEVSTGGRRQFRDVRYDPLDFHIELDGRFFHDNATARDEDLERDLDDAAAGAQALRLGWGQVVGRPCRTAGKVGRVMAARGWAGRPRPCGPDCELRRV